MPPPDNLSTLRRGFVDICRGYSVGTYKGSTIYIKHLGHVDHMAFDDIQLAFKNEAIAEGAKTEEERLQYLVSKGLWSASKDEDIERQRDTIARFEDGRRTIPQPSMLRLHDKQTQDERDKLVKMLTEKGELIGVTAETYATQRLNDHYIINNLFSDVAMSHPFFSESSFEDFNNSEVEDITAAYNAATDCCSDANIKRLVVQDFYITYYSACNDNLYTFFGRPVCQMTYYMVKCGSYSRYFKRLMEDTDLSRLSREKRMDPDMIESTHQTQRNTATMAADGKVPTNLTASDIKELNLEGKFTKLPQKSMGMEDMIKHMRANGGARQG